MVQKLLDKLLKEDVNQFPSSRAMIIPSNNITYAELSVLSNQFAQELVNLNVQSNSLVAIVMEKGWEQIVAVLGILKSGAAYLTIDPNESKEQLHSLLSSGSVKVALTQSKFEKRLEWPSDVEVMVVTAAATTSPESSSH